MSLHKPRPAPERSKRFEKAAGEVGYRALKKDHRRELNLARQVQQQREKAERKVGFISKKLVFETDADLEAEFGDRLPAMFRQFHLEKALMEARGNPDIYYEGYHRVELVINSDQHRKQMAKRFGLSNTEMDLMRSRRDEFPNLRMVYSFFGNYWELLWDGKDE